MGKNSKKHKREMDEAQKKRREDPAFKADTELVADTDIFAEYESIGGIIWRKKERDPEGEKVKKEDGAK